MRSEPGHACHYRYISMLQEGVLYYYNHALRLRTIRRIDQSTYRLMSVSL